MLHSLESGQSNFNIAQHDSMNPYRLLSVALSFPFFTDLQPARCSATGENANDERIYSFSSTLIRKVPEQRRYINRGNAGTSTGGNNRPHIGAGNDREDSEPEVTDTLGPEVIDALGLGSDRLKGRILGQGLFSATGHLF